MAIQFLDGETASGATDTRLATIKKDATTKYGAILYDAFLGFVKYYDRVNSAVRTLVNLDQAQTLTNKTLTAPTISSATLTKPQAYNTPTVLSGDGAIDISLGDLFNITKGSAAAITLADPVAGDNGRVIHVYSSSAFAHTITLASGVNGAGGTDDVVTFTNRAAASITLKAVATKWIVVGSYLAAIA